jgi:Ty3 transposon capsid-like protein/Zinc knuckle
MANNGNNGNNGNPPGDPQNPPAVPATPARLFNSLTAAEAAYRQQTDQNRLQLAQFSLLNNKIDVLINSINRLVNAMTPGQPPPPDRTEPEQQSLPPPDPEANRRREFMERDRSAPPEIEETTDTELPVAPFSSNSRSLTGVKLPRFYGKYTEDVNSWISIIEDQFFLHSTKEKYKVANVSPLLQDDALTWYSWLKGQYRRPITWPEFKRELRTKYAESTVRTSALREKLKTVPYNGPNSVEKYVSKFRSLEQQISAKEMAFGDRLHYFISPFETEFRRAIKREHPKTMELAYDAAIDWAYINQDDSDASTNPQGPPLLTPATNETKKKKDDASDDDELDVMDMRQVTCYNCNKLGHFARDCRKPRNDTSDAPSTRSKVRFSSYPKRSQSQKFYMLDNRVYSRNKDIFDTDSESGSESLY